MRYEPGLHDLLDVLGLSGLLPDERRPEPVPPARMARMQQHHTGAFATVAFGWVQHHPDQWERWLVRRCGQCHHIDWVKLIWVDEECMTCLYCLSQDVVLDDKTDPPTCLCNECGARSQLDLEEDDETDDLDDDDDADPDPDEWDKYRGG